MRLTVRAPSPAARHMARMERAVVAACVQCGARVVFFSFFFLFGFLFLVFFLFSFPLGGDAPQAQATGVRGNMTKSLVRREKMELETYIRLIHVAR